MICQRAELFGEINKKCTLLHVVVLLHGVMHEKAEKC